MSECLITKTQFCKSLGLQLVGWQMEKRERKAASFHMLTLRYLLSLLLQTKQSAFHASTPRESLKIRNEERSRCEKINLRGHPEETLSLICWHIIRSGNKSLKTVKILIKETDYKAPR